MKRTGPPQTPYQMERLMRAAVMSGRVKVRARPIANEYANVHLGKTPHPITVDPLRGGLLDNVLHELIHVVIADELARWGYFEEPMVIAFEQVMVHYVNASPRRVAWWRRHINEALDED